MQINTTGEQKLQFQHACLRILAHGKAKEVEELAKRKDAAMAAYLAARDGTPPLAGDDLKVWRKEALAAASRLLVAKKARKALDEAAVVMRSLADSIALEVVKLEGTLQDLTLMGCGHPDVAVPPEGQGLHEGGDGGIEVLVPEAEAGGVEDAASEAGDDTGDDV